MERERILGLMRSCLNPPDALTDEAIAAAAKDLGVEEEVIRAIKEKESGDAKSQESYEGRPVVLFERKVFHDRTRGKYDEAHPDISSDVWRPAGKYRAQYGRVDEAFELDPRAALESTSWGFFQIMGFNHKRAGFEVVEDMVLAMARSAQVQLDAFVAFVKSDSSLHKNLKNKNWLAIAVAYNGSGQAANNYAPDIEAKYERLKTVSKAKKAAGSL